ncbi:peptide ligase PGM1-related protein [Pedococcus bigeumensis]|uniref:peptide ligase PGM1-related protein n=1 Tax=Pedococcus bigeumensis TaxID=433644 RepID=UPI002FEA3749
MVIDAERQAGLADAVRVNHVGSTTPHVVVILPSFSLADSLLAHYATRIGAYEHRYLLGTLMLPRVPGCQIVFVTCQTPEPEVLDYYDRLASPARPGGLLDRLHVVTVDDPSPRSVSAKLLDRPDLLDHVRRLTEGRLAFIEPWNVTDTEVEVSRALGVPLNGTDPAVWPLCFKSAGRRLFREVGVPIPVGIEDVRDVAGVGEAVARIRRERPRLHAVVVKHDNSGAGDGNVVVVVRDASGRRVRQDDIVASLRGSLPAWYVTDLGAGAVVEELLTGGLVHSPSAQVDIRPDGSVSVLSTHEQILGGENGQVYSGCRFPADPEYAGRLGEHAAAVGRWLADRGARGRLGVDFLAVRRHGRWDVRALEVNLRKGGTTHPFSALRHLVPGSYDAATGRYDLEDRSGTRCYRSSDGLLDPSWMSLTPRRVIDAVAAAGLEFDPGRRTGVVLHLLSGLRVDGRLGVTAIGADRDEAERLYADTERVVASQVS